MPSQVRFPVRVQLSEEARRRGRFKPPLCSRRSTPRAKPLRFPQAYQELLKPVYLFSRSKGIKLFLVGGILRDLLLGRKRDSLDFDFCLKGSAINFGRALAKKMRCAFVILDQEHAVARLVKKHGGSVYTFDFSAFRGRSLQEDLALRDFTVDSIAARLEDVFSCGDLRSRLIDPCGGLQDIEARRVRLDYKRAFADDPLRILRLFSLCSILGFKPDKQALKSASFRRCGLLKVSGERIRDELFKIFSYRSYETIAAMDKLKLLEVFLPEIRKMCGIGQGPYHHLDVWQHTLESLKQLEAIAEELRRRQGIRDYLSQQVSSGRSRLALLKFAALLHDIGKPAALRREKGKIIFHGHERIGLNMTRQICRRLKLSNEESSSLERIVLWHLRPGYLADNDTLTARAKFRYFRDTGADALAVLLLSLADQRSTKGPKTTALSRARHEKTVFSLIAELFKKEKKPKPAPLLDGNDIMRKFKLEPSPLIGKLLSEAQELQAIGKLKNKEQAYARLARMIKRGK